MRHWPYLVLIALLAGSAAQAAPNEPPLLPPPMAQPQDLSIFRGRSTVPLRAQGRTRSVEAYPVRPSKDGRRDSHYRTQIRGCHLHARKRRRWC
jgi:hypothetical protein